MSNDPPPTTDDGPIPGVSPLTSGLVLAVILGLGAGLGIVFHDGKSWTEGLAAGCGFSGLGFVLGYSRVARIIADILSLIR